MNYIEDFVQSKSVDGKMPLPEIYHFMKVSYRMPMRTVQWYVKEQLIPKADKDWKDGFYPKEKAIEVLERAYLIFKLKEYMSVQFSTIRNIFRMYEKDIDSLLNELIAIVDEYKALKRGDNEYEPILNEENAEIVRRVCEKIEQGVSLKKISAPDIQQEIRRQG